MKDIDPELKYCPECSDEYLAEIIHCAVCEVELITGEELTERLEARRKKLQSRSLEISPDDDLVPIRRGQLPEMQKLQQLLVKENIGSLLVGDMGTCAKDRFGNTMGHPTNYDLQLKREDALAASEIIEIEHRKETHLGHHDDTNGDFIFNHAAQVAKCPACGHTFPTSKNACPDCGLVLG